MAPGFQGKVDSRGPLKVTASCLTARLQGLASVAQREPLWPALAVTGRADGPPYHQDPPPEKHRQLSPFHGKWGNVDPARGSAAEA